MISLREGIGQPWNAFTAAKYYTDIEILNIRRLYEQGAPWDVISARTPPRSVAAIKTHVSNEIKATRMTKILPAERASRWAARGA